MRVVIYCCLLLVVAVPSSAALRYPTPDDQDAIGLYISPGDYIACTYAPFLSHAIFWLVVTNPTHPISVLDCQVRMEPENGSGSVFLCDWRMEGGWQAESEPPIFICRPPGWQMTGDIIAVASVDVLVLDPWVEIGFFIEPTEGANDVQYWTVYGRGMRLTRINDSHPQSPLARINPYNDCYPTAGELITWGAVKSLYRE